MENPAPRLPPEPGGRPLFPGRPIRNRLTRERVKSAALNGQIPALKGFRTKPQRERATRFRAVAPGQRFPVIEEVGDMLSLDDGQLSTINGVEC